MAVHPGGTQQLEFAGSAEEQTLARRVFEIMTGQGSLAARDALIRQSLDNLAAYLSAQDNTSAEQLAPRIEAAISANSDVFKREERDGTVIVSTSRRGASSGRQPDRRHTFAQRLYEPVKPLPVEDINNIVTTIRPPLTTVEPVQISNYWRALAGQAPLEVDLVVPTAETPVEAPAEEAPVPAAEAPAMATPAVVEPEPAVEATPQPTVPQPVPVQRPVAPRPAVSLTTVLLSDGTAVDLKRPVDDLMAEFGAALQAEVAAAFSEDPLRRVVSFGAQYYSADALPNFGKNDLRRIRDYIIEQAEPMPDVSILSDVYRERPGTNSFEVFRFGLNYRLSRERDFEFVGMEGLSLWSAKGLPAIGSKRVKASDLGQFYSFQVEGFDETEPSTDGTVSHYLTPFEWEYGVLAMNAAFASIMPQPLLPEQRSAALRIEAPQHYSTYLAEVRFPTVNRGGWIWGLEDFFREYLVPGTLITLSATEEANGFTIAYEEIGGVEEKLLHFEEKRNRFVFMPVTYYAAVDEDLLPSQRRYGKLRNLKPLPMNDRKKTDVVLEHVFETMGEQLGTKEEPMYWIQFNELHLAITVLRPMSRAYLEYLLGQDPAFYADEATVGAYYYKPAPKAEEPDDTVDDEDLDDDE
ncbi:MAG: hypothetical protein M3R24_07000 [Chloroflexota bacterium]|nr:hypothetical protein [Chloroflexota bacterium]